MTFLGIQCLIGLAMWLASGCVAAGVVFACFQRRYPSIRLQEFNGDAWFSLLILLTGPLGLVGAWMAGQFGHGWLWPWSRRAYREAFGTKRDEVELP